MSNGVFRRRPALPRRGRRALPTGLKTVAAALGVSAALFSGDAVAVKVVSLGGTCSLGASSSGQAVKAAPARGECSTGASGGSTPIKLAVETGSSAVGQAGSSSQSTVRTGTGGTSSLAPIVTAKSTSAAASMIGFHSYTAGNLFKVVSAVGTCSLGVGGQSGASGKSVPLSGTSFAGFDGTSGATKTARPSGTTAVGLASETTFPATQVGQAATGVDGHATSVKVAVQSGRAVVGGAPRGMAVAVKPIGGRSVLAGTPAGTSRGKISPVQGTSFLLLGTRGLPVVVGPTSGTRVSAPLALPEEPIGGSRITWSSTVPSGSTLTIETSVDNGASWQLAVNGESVARLVPGTTTARTVLTRVTMTRVNATDPSPRLHRMELRVAIDSSRNEFCPLGAFTLNDVSVDDSPNGLEIEISGADFSRKIARNRWEDTYVVAENTNYADAIRELITNRLPGTVFNFASTSRLTPRLFFGEQSGNDPWQDAQDMANAIGHELFFDATGICVLRPEPNPDIDDSVWVFEDSANPTMTSLVRRVTDVDTYNKVIVTGEGTGNAVPVRAVAIDSDPSSPTYFLGLYGTVTLIVRSPMVTTVEQAQEAADARLLRAKGATEAVELDAVPMPALEPGDVVTVSRNRSQVDGRFLIDQLRIPLGADGSMRAVGRRQRL